MSSTNKVYERKALIEISKELSQVAMGNLMADLVIENSCLVNVNTRELIENTSVAVYKGRIAYVGPSAKHCIGEQTKVFDAKGKYLAPGLLDGHIHVESSMISVSEYAKAVVPHGTTGIFMDPHEIANVLGLEGVKLMVGEGDKLPINIWATVPSCVPAMPGYEYTGASFNVKDIEEALTYTNIAGLGEMMNFPGVIYANDEVHQKLEATYNQNMVVTGHYAHPDLDKGLNAYAASGISSCHESVSKEDALYRARLGMYAQVREGSAWQDVKETVRAITEDKADSRYFMLVSDDCHPHTLLEKGHLDYIVKRAIEEKVDPIEAIQMASLNCATYFKKDHEVGSISPSKFADMILISDLENMKVDEVFYNGFHVASNGEMLIEIERPNYPTWAKESMHLGKELSLADVQIAAPKDYINNTINARIIEVMEASAVTKHIVEELKVENGLALPDSDKDIAKLIVFDRHTKSGTRGCGFVKGLGIKKGAVASTVAHDAHNLMVIGLDDEDMLLALQTLEKCGGGMVAVYNKEVLALNELEIAGLMSNDNVQAVANKVAGLDNAWKDLGCEIASPFMTMAILPLACIPEIRLTNCGLVDTVNFKFVDLFVLA